MAVKTTGYWDDDRYSKFQDFETMWGYGATGGKKLGADYVFDPKNPPIYGCTDYHPPLMLKVNGKASEIYGSSCIRPNIDDADIYISLDSMAKNYDWENPWENSSRKHIRYFIKDGGVPENQKQFDKCIDYIVESLDQGKKVHAGCIAGHGRTGLLLAAVAQKAMGDILKEEGISAIDYVRDNYCANAVETFRQVLYLYGVHDVEPPAKQSQRVRDFEEIFTREMGVDFRTVVKESEFFKMQAIIQDIDRQISVEYASRYTPTTLPKRRELTLAEQELEDLFFNYEMKTVDQLDLSKPVNKDNKDNTILGGNVDVKDMDFDFSVFEEGETFTIATPINDTNPVPSEKKFSFGKK